MEEMKVGTWYRSLTKKYSLAGAGSTSIDLYFFSLPVTRLDPVSPTTSSDVVLLDTSKNDVEMSVSKRTSKSHFSRLEVLSLSGQDKTCLLSLWSDFPLILE